MSAAYFLSDAHLGAGSREIEGPRERRLRAFLRSIEGRASHLYVVGDLFDFWFEWGAAIPRRHFAVLAALERLIESGTRVTWLNGNHDFWLGRFPAEIGIHTVDGAHAVELQGRRIWLHHGDGLIGGDLGYRALKRVVRHPLSVRLYQLLHPDWAMGLAHAVSHGSRRSRAEKPLEPERLWREIALPRFAEGYDAVMVGHFHHAYERREREGEFFILGDWMRFFTYVVLEDGRLRMETWPGD